MFIFFINDLAKSVRFSKIAMYADDIVLYASHPNPRLAVRNVQVDLNAIGAWCDENSMTVNESKTQSMWFTSTQTRRTLPDLALSINGKKLTEVTHYSYLGVELDTDLSLAKTIEGLHDRAEAPMLNLRRDELLVTMMYKRSKKVTSVTKIRSTRSDGKFVFPCKRPRTAMYRKSPFYRGTLLWDKLPPKYSKLKKKNSSKLKLNPCTVQEQKVKELNTLKTETE